MIFFWLRFQIRSKSRNYSFARWEGKSLPFSRIFISSITDFGCFCSDCCAKYFVSLKANKKEGDNQSAHEFNCLRLFTNFSRGSIQKHPITCNGDKAGTRSYSLSLPGNCLYCDFCQWPSFICHLLVC